MQFSIRTLLRSRQHRVILSFYLGLAFGLAIFFAKSPVQEHCRTRIQNRPLASGERADAGGEHRDDGRGRAGSARRFLPSSGSAGELDLSRHADSGRAGRRHSSDDGEPPGSLRAGRHSGLGGCRGGLPVAMAVAGCRGTPRSSSGLLGAILAELCLHNFHKIPFTCSYLPGRSYAHMVFLSLIGLMVLIVQGADLERRALESPAGMATMLVAFASLAAWARWRTDARAQSPEGTVQFEEAPVPEIMGLGLNRDGSSPV